MGGATRCENRGGGDGDGAAADWPGGGLALAMIAGVIAWALFLMYAL